jgi:hypothetical protein
MSADEYNRPPLGIPRRTQKTSDSRPPYYPFQSQADFELAGLALDALNHRQLDQLLSTIQRCLQGDDKLTFQQSSDVYNTWKHAAEMTTPVRTCLGCILISIQTQLEYATF